MRRLHLFELEDQSWFPPLFRSFITDLLEYQLHTFQVYHPILPKLKVTLESLKNYEILDLCSGSGGQWLSLYPELQSQLSEKLTLTLSDKYPNLQAFQSLANLDTNHIQFCDYAVDAKEIPSKFKGFRTIFTAFHHFPPETAQKILQDAVNNNVPIGIFEFTERNWINLLKIILFGPVLVWLQTPLIKPFKISRFFWTYLLPLVPLFYTWDGFVSHLRTYSLADLKIMVSGLENYNLYHWDIGQIKQEKLLLNLTYLIGFPQEKLPKQSPI